MGISHNVFALRFLNAYSGPHYLANVSVFVRTFIDLMPEHYLPNPNPPNFDLN